MKNQRDRLIETVHDFVVRHLYYDPTAGVIDLTKPHAREDLERIIAASLRGYLAAREFPAVRRCWANLQDDAEVVIDGDRDRRDLVHISVTLEGYDAVRLTYSAPRFDVDGDEIGKGLRV